MKNAEILVVEDESITAMDIKHKLERLGYKVLAIESSGRKAIERTRELKPDLILMDIILKGEIDGIDAAARIHGDFDIPIIYLTAYFDDMILERAKLTDPYGYIIKPFSDGELKSAIEIALYKHALKLESTPSPDKNIGNLDLEDIIDAPAIQSFMDDFYKLTGIPVGIIDLKGDVLVGVGWQDICTKFHRVHPETHKHCIESDLQLSEGVPPGEYKLYKCKNNMWDIVTPIMISNQHLGNIFLGQFFFEDEQLDYEFFRKQARKYGFNEEEYITALKSVPRLKKETINETMSFFMKLANIISQLSYINVKLAKSLTERDTLMNSLQESEEYQKTILSTVQTGIIVIDAETKKIIDINKAALRLIGAQRDKVIGHICHKFICPANEKQCPIIDLNQVVDNSERILLNINNEEISIIKTVAQITLKGRKCLIESFIDITELRSAENALRKSEAALRSFFNSNDVFMSIMELIDNDIIYILPNRRMAEFFGSCVEDITGKHLAELDVSPDLQNFWINKLKECLKTGKTVNIEFDLSNNTYERWYQGSISQIKGKSSKKLFSFAAVEITENKLMEDKIKTSLKEKELLLHEIHHRVKNNLQIISSLLNLQSRYIHDNETLNAFKESQNRVRSLAMIHEKLYKSSSLVKIDFKEYITDLADNLFYTYKINSRTIKLNMDIDNIFFDIDTAIPCGLIVNELVTNCLKHAFPSLTAEGCASVNAPLAGPTALNDKPLNELSNNLTIMSEINIKLNQVDGNFVLSIGDNGIGMPKDFNFTNTNSLGLQLVNNLVDQLDGTITLDSTEGTEFRIIFRKLKYKERL